jgi:RES domain-containing protein
MRVWRICRRRYADAAFSGEGPRLFAGRWNPARVAMVYASSHLSLAAIEVFVHLEVRTEPDDLVAVGAELPCSESELLPAARVLFAKLPKDWRRLESQSLRKMGADWIAAGRTLALMVPSAVIEDEWNVLINPAHPEMAGVKIHGKKPFRFDARMFR